MRPYNFYIFELIVRVFYILLSYCLCLAVVVLNSNTFFLFETYPFITIVSKRFISTCITDFVDGIWILGYFTSVIFVLPLFIYHVNSFFCNSWYIYQINFYKKLVYLFLGVFLFTYFFVHHIILPVIFSFFLYWEITEKSSLLRIEVETRILSYINWVLLLKLLFSFLVSLVFLFLSIFLYIFKIEHLYKFLKFNKNVLIFIFIFLSFLLIPPDFFLQLFIVFFNIILFNIVFFLLCIKFYKDNYKF